MTIAVQTAVGEVGRKAVSSLSWSFDALVNCGQHQYGANENGIYLLNSGDDDDGVAFSSSFTLATSDYGVRQKKRFERLYLEVEVYGDTTFTIGIRPGNGSWVSITEAVTGAGLKNVIVKMPRGVVASFYAVRISSPSRFRIHGIDAEVAVSQS